MALMGAVSALAALLKAAVAHELAVLSAAACVAGMPRLRAALQQAAALQAAELQAAELQAAALQAAAL